MESKRFLPKRRAGMIFHWVMILVLFGAIFFCVWQATTFQEGAGLILWSSGALFLCIPLVFIIYRLYGFFRGEYVFDGETFTLRWGLRLERIPILDIEWIRSAEDLTTPLSIPRFSTPGGCIGIQSHPDLGNVEFLASDRKSLILVATAKKVFAISPNNPISFVQDFQRRIEIGSSAPVKAQSVYPTYVVGKAWESQPTRLLWVIGMLLNIGLLVWVSFLAPRIAPIPLGFLTAGVPRSIVPGIQLFLLPIISIFFFLVNWLAGIFFSRRAGMHTLANIIWGFSILSAAFFLIAVGFIITTQV